ncbi:MAG: twin-arginine translocation signal domain-containing protein, partial [Actinomycetota bacterium]|nr:twin-arginine translocation signal domain-containing protein [Actinomycetota bacterium]
MPLSRRDFLVRTGAAGMSVGLAGSLDALFTSLPAAGA